MVFALSVWKHTTVIAPQQTGDPFELQENVALCDKEIERDLQILRESGDLTVFRNCVENNAADGALNEHLDALNLSASVFVSTNDRILLGYNRIAGQYNAFELSMLGRRTPNHPSGSSRYLDETTDKALLGGARVLWYEHEAPAANGHWFRWSTLKMRVLENQSRSFCLLNLSRPVQLLPEVKALPSRMLNEQLVMYRQLDETDRRICEGIAVGDSTAEIAAAVGLTRRSIEVRRGKILEHFGFSRKVQIVRLLVRLEENGLLPD
ncbi:DNA-binding CsgD family transcriptional regulator [Rhodopirellula rubra]|uniref:DNA-binding CsgD family transcriptional regulator n=1 Tax=Aporhodopirellula rubra TaxID=980271 RepID=A0A7W5DZB2_9BACT|nr:DNA-binding CsgD family transcriptional regulator [Aporhodopirellula rubra]